jgi:hypothetical protein
MATEWQPFSRSTIARGITRNGPSHADLVKAVRKLTDDQRRFLDRRRQAGGIGVEVRDVKTIADALGILPDAL